MKKAMTKLNNRGATLIIVIISLLLVGIIAAVVLTITTGNVKNIFSASKSTSNFYSAEKTIDEIRSNLQVYADEAASRAYTEWLQKYSDIITNSESAEDKFNEFFVNALMDELKKKFPDSGDPADIEDIMLGTTPLGTSIEWAGIPEVVIEDGKVVLKNLSIEYKDSDGTDTIITTDIVFDMKYPGLAANRVSFESLACSTYAVIADTQISNYNAAGLVGGNVTMEGNVYGGGLAADGTYTGVGISCIGGSVNIKGDYVLTRSTIDVDGNSSLTIAGQYLSGSRMYSSIWAKNIDMTDKINKSGSPVIKVTGDCYLSDDLTVETDGSTFTMTSGSSFYGYNTTDATATSTSKDSDGRTVVNRVGTPAGSSAIVLNGKNASIDLYDAKQVWIAGKTFINVPSIMIGDTNTESIENATFGEGESLSYRALQAAYLLPGECVVGVGHNPMTLKEYKSLFDSSTGKLLPGAINLDNSRERGNVDLNLYVNSDPASAYRTAYVRYHAGNTTDTMVYLYLNFISPNAASDYFAAYYGLNADLVISRMKQFGTTGSILVNPANLINTGNVLANVLNSENEAVSDKYVVYESAYDRGLVTSREVEYKQIALSTKFKALTTGLSESDFTVSAATHLTDSIVDYAVIDSVDSKYDPLNDYALCESTVGGTKIEGCKIFGKNCKLYTGSTVTIGAEGGAGIIISTGNVYISGDFYGLVIARGNVVLNGNAKVINHQTADIANTQIAGKTELSSSSEVIKYIIMNEDTVKQLFRISTVANKEKDIYSSDLISLEYKNWKKE